MSDSIAQAARYYPRCLRLIRDAAGLHGVLGGVPPRVFGFCLLSLALILACTRVSAHVGDEIYPFYELRDEDAARIDLTDGSVEDWLEVVGEASLTAVDFLWEGRYGGPRDYNPSDVDFRIWLAWHQGSGTLWVAMERVDDLYVNLYEGVHDNYVNIGGDAMSLSYWDSGIFLVVDGDHSGGRYRYVNWAWCQDCPREELLENQRQAQTWQAIGDAPAGEHLVFYGLAHWAAREPYAAAGGGALGESPAVSVTEFRVTPFDDLIYDDEQASVASDLYAGKVIGFHIQTQDNDDPLPPFDGGMRLSLPGRNPFGFADSFVDGLLLGAGEDPSLYDVSAVAPSSWARIKAALHAR